MVNGEGSFHGTNTWKAVGEAKHAPASFAFQICMINRRVSGDDVWLTDVTASVIVDQKTSEKRLEMSRHIKTLHQCPTRPVYVRRGGRGGGVLGNVGTVYDEVIKHTSKPVFRKDRLRLRLKMRMGVMVLIGL